MFLRLVPSLGFQSAGTLDESSASAAGAAGATAVVSAEQQSRLQQTALENAANAIVITDRTGEILWTNPAFTTLTGYPAADAIGQTPRLLKSGEHDEAFYQDLWRTIQSGQTWRGEFTNRRKDGSHYQGEQVITPVRGDDGAITHFVAVMNDVTARRHAEAAQRAAHRQLQHLLDHSPAVTYSFKWQNQRAIPHAVSENITRLLGCSVAEATSREWWFGHLHPEDRERALASIPETLTHEASQTEYRLRRSDGGYCWIQDNRRLIRDGAERPVEFIGVWTDIAERKRAEDVLRDTMVRRPRQHARRITIELSLIVVGAAMVFLGENLFGWFEPAFAVLADHATHPLADETTLMAAFLMLAMVVFSYRRWRESRAEAMSQHNLAEAMRTLHGELDARVQQRTAELARANEGLRAEVTGRQRADAALRESEERYRALVDHAPTGIFVNTHGRFAYLNATMCRIFGAKTAEQLLGMSTLDRIHSDSLDAVRDRIARGQAGESVPLMDQRYLRLDGSVVEVETMATPITFQGQPAIQVMVNDVSRRKQAEVALRETEAQFRDLAENIHEVFWLTTPGLEEILYVSPGYERIWGRTCASLRAAPREWLDAIHPDDRARVSQAFGKMAAGLYDEEYRIVRPDGSLRWIRDRAFPVSSVSGKIHRIAGLAEDITERKRAEARLRLQHGVTQILSEASSSERVNRLILETIARDLDWEVGELWLVDRAKHALRCVEISHPVSAEFDAFARASRELTFASGAGLQGRVWQEGRAIWVSDVQLETDFPRRALAEKLGLRSWVGFPIKRRDQVVGVVGFFSAQVRELDEAMAATLVTLGSQFGQFLEKQQLTEQFQQAQKMEALGTLAGGIAHDFNNIIAGIAGYTELAKMSAPRGTELVEHLDAVLKCSARAANLVKQILAFSRHEEHERRPMQLRHIVSEAMHLLRATIPTTIAFESSFAHNLPTVRADANQVHQIVMNLGSNAWHAMRGRAGRLGVRLEIFEVDAAVAEIHPGLKPGRYVRLSVSDTGHGMDAATLTRIFDPFFTTKGPGEGTGLGLAVVHGIMQSHEGVITVYSQPGEGTVFHLYFPCSEGAETGEKPADGAIPQGHGERVLYVDDEPLLARMSQCALEQLGYAADVQTDPLAALELLRRNPHGYDLVITDLTMPMLSGTEFAGELLKLRPDLPVMLVTGYAAGLTVGQAHALGFREFLLKPHSVHTLGRAVARVLAAKSHSLHA